MMGKRVNHACRAVISPDPYIAVNEIGIPYSFAMKLTYPQRVTPWNVEKSREAIINGPDIHPGATCYPDKAGMLIRGTRETRTSLARKILSSERATTQFGKTSEDDVEGKIVYRHMQDGDVVLVNHQPTLHKPSIMAHIVRILKGEKTLRLHYANCSAYNADFDCEEMNVHFPQDEISRAEAYNIVNANNQYARPSNGGPLRALIQDHIVSSVLLTKRDTLLDKDEFCHLLFSSGVTDMGLSSFSGRPGKKVMESASDAELLIITPAILKPVALWTGKQVITAVLNQITKGHPPFTIERATKLPVDFFKCRSRDVKLKSGEYNNKKHLTKQQDIDESWKRDLDEDKLLIRKNEFVCGVIDKAQFEDYGLVHTVHEFYGSNAAGNLLSVFSRLFTAFLQIHGFTCGVDDLIILRDMDKERKKQLQECEQVGERVLRKTFGIGVDVQMDTQDMISRIQRIVYKDGESALADLDRSIVNELNQCLNKGVMNDFLSDGLLKTPGKNCISLMTLSGAKGSKVNFQQMSSHLGQQDLEGKRVPRMVSGKTLPCFHPWDWSPRAGGFISDRFLSGLRPQEYYFHCMAGREGLIDTAVKTSRSGHLHRCMIKSLESLKVEYDCTVRDADGSIIQFQYGEDGVDVHRSSFIGKFKELTVNQDMILQRCSEDMLSGPSSYITDLPSTLKKGAEKFLEAMPMNERIASKLVRQEELLKLVKLKFFASLAQPGEPVGVLAAQSVGESSTPMTSHTFHLAGRGEMNVTLGIPRLHEILMTAAADIKTPIMTCPLRKGKTNVDANDITDKLRKITVADIIKSMKVSVEPYAVHGSEACSIYKLEINLYKPKDYPKHTDITEEDWKETMTVMFLRKLEDAIEIHMKMLYRIRGIKNFVEDTRPEAGNETDNNDSVSGKQTGDEDDEGEGSEFDDLGSDAQKQKMQATDERDYEEYSEDEKNEPSSITEEDLEMDNEDENAEASEEETPEPLNVEEGSTKKRHEFVKADTDRHIFVQGNGKTFEVHFKFSTKEPHILLAQIAQKTAQKVYIQNSGKIERCTVGNCGDPQVIYYGENPKERKEISNKEKKAAPAIYASGVDFPILWQFQDKLDVRYLYSNSIQDMLNTFGVEAARETIIRELNHVFKSYGISVSIRHLNLIADYMTFSGRYRPVSLMGGIAESTSPFCRMTYDTATKFLVQAATYGEKDTLETPSARICLGLPVLAGTGCFDVLQKAYKVLNLERNSLEFLLQHFCGVAANKEYAREDLLYIYDVIRLELQRMVKDDEYTDSPLLEVYKRTYDVCTQLYERELMTENSDLYVYGHQTTDFKAAQLAIFAGLCEWRNYIAHVEDKSTGYVLPNEVLLEIATEIPASVDKLRQMLKSKHPYIERNVESVVSVIRQSMQICSVLIDATGLIRDQKGHKLCWGYALTDLISAARVLQGCDLKFTPLCTHYLCEHVNPTVFKRTLVPEDEGHRCYTGNFAEGVSYIKLHGIPKERPGHEDFMCGEKRPSIKDEELFHIEDIYEYHTLEQALVRLKTHPVVATLIMFDGWVDRKIYRGPLREGAKFVEMHLVIIVDCKKIDGEMVAICKSSNGRGVGFDGYIHVSLEVMFIMAGATRKAAKYNFCHIEPQHLLFDFYSIDVKRGSYEPKIREDPRTVQDNSLFKVDLNYHDFHPRQKAKSYLGIVSYSQDSCSLVEAPLTDSDSITLGNECLSDEGTSAIHQPSVARVKMMKVMASDSSTAEVQGEFSELRQTAGSSSTFVIQAQPYLNAIPMPLRLEVICLKACTHPTLFDHFQRELRDVLKDLKRKKILENWEESESWKLLKENANIAHYQEGAHGTSQPKPFQGIFGMDSEKVKAIHARIDEFISHMSQLLQMEMEVTQKDLDVIPIRDESSVALLVSSRSELRKTAVSGLTFVIQAQTALPLNGIKV